MSQPPAKTAARVSFEASFAGRIQTERTHHVRPEQRLQFLGPRDTQNDLLVPVSYPPSRKIKYVLSALTQSCQSVRKSLMNLENYSAITSSI